MDLLVFLRREILLTTYNIIYNDLVLVDVSTTIHYVVGLYWSKVLKNTSCWLYDFLRFSIINTK
jgi:hypothetical protein